MSRLVVFTFDGAEQAAQVRAVFRNLEMQKHLALNDAVVVVKDAGGQVQCQRMRSHAIWIGAVAGGAVGLLLMFMFPVIGIVFGAVVGALIARFLDDQKVDEEEIESVSAALKPDNSALLLLIRLGNVSMMTSALQHAHAHVYQTTLTPELDASLRQSLP